MKLDNNNHSVFSMYYHLVLVTKYRRKVINHSISVRLREIFDYIAIHYNIFVVEWNEAQDHVHILFKAHPNSELSKFINAYKSASSRLIKKEYPEIKEKLWKENFWSRSFCLITTGGVTIDVIKEYIESQGDQHEKNIAYKYRIYPNHEQQILISKTFGCVRFIFNKMLEDRISYYKETGLSLNNTPTMYKKEYEWLKEVDSLALANAQLHLNAAYKNFFRDPKVGFPKFKSKKDSSNTYTTNMVNNNIKLIGNKIYLPKLKGVRIKKHREIPEDYSIKSVTVSKTPTRKYYVSILCEYETEVIENKGNNYLGLDYAMDGLYVASNNTRGEYPRYYRQLESKLAREQRKLSKMTKGSNNYQKQKHRVAKVHEKISNSRKDFLHKTSHQIDNDVDGVCVEDLNMQGMSQALNYGKSVHDNGYGMFLNMLSYKLEREGKKLIKIDKYYPSSKTCSNCGYINRELKLSERIYECPQCGMKLDRDYNASLNILSVGKRIVAIA